MCFFCIVVFLLNKIRVLILLSSKWPLISFEKLSIRQIFYDYVADVDDFLKNYQDSPFL